MTSTDSATIEKKEEVHLSMYMYTYDCNLNVYTCKLVFTLSTLRHMVEGNHAFLSMVCRFHGYISIDNTETICVMEDSSKL